MLESGPYFELSTVDVPAGVLTDGSSGAVIDIDGDGEMDVLAAGKTGLFLMENLTRR